MLSQAFMSSCNSHHEFKKILNKMDGKVDTIKLEQETINSHDLSRFYEWAKISAAKHAAENTLSF